MSPFVSLHEGGSNRGEAGATKTITYSYDARARLAKAGRSGTLNTGFKPQYSYDKGDNRTDVCVISPNSPP